MLVKTLLQRQYFGLMSEYDEPLEMWECSVSVSCQHQMSEDVDCSSSSAKHNILFNGQMCKTKIISLGIPVSDLWGFLSPRTMKLNRSKKYTVNRLHEDKFSHSYASTLSVPNYKSFQESWKVKFFQIQSNLYNKIITFTIQIKYHQILY